MKKLPKKSGKDKDKPVELTRRAHPGDHVFFHHPDSGPMSGHVVCCGKHGATVKTEDGQHHKVHWERVLGHKQRAERAVQVIDRGEDGAICEDQTGKRFWLSGDLPDEAPDGDDTEPDDGDDDMQKSMVIFTSGAARAALRKAAIANAAGLALRDTTDKEGHQTKRWMKTAPDEKKGRQPGKSKDPGDRSANDPHTEARQKVVGKVVPFTAGAFDGKGEVVAAGKDGVTIKDDSGREHQVHWHELHAGGDNAGHPEDRGEHWPTGKGFDAAAYAAEHDQADVAPEHIISQFGDDLKQKLDDVKGKLNGLQETIELHKRDGEYTPERQKLHSKIIDHFLSDERIKAATPDEGEAPTFTILGGRGGSGKSWFNGKTYDPGKAIVLDADEIKGMLPEYEGWNAHQVHEESGDIFDHITDMAVDMGLNIVHDATMKTKDKAVNLVKRFKDAGYRVEAHYMHLPRQEAAKRAVSRFMGQSGRYVPVEVVLSNTGNEKTFEAIKPLVDKWSFRDNNVGQGEEPKLIAEGSAEPAKEDAGGAAKPDDRESGERMTKALQEPIIILWRRS